MSGDEQIGMDGNRVVRVLWLTPDKPENISVGRQCVAKQLDQRGFEVVVRGTSWETVWKSIRERHEYDVVLGTTRAGGVAATAVGRFCSIPVVVDHIDPIRQLYETHPKWFAAIVERLENATFRLADHILYVYDEEHDRIARRTSSYSSTNLGVDHERFASADQTILDAAEDRLSAFDLSENFAIYVGGLEPIYNISSLLEAIDHLSKWSLVIAGTGSLEDSVRELANTSDDIIFLGAVPHEEVPGLLHHATVGLSLVDDPHTLKVLEYLSAGLPIVQLDGRARRRFGDYVTYCSIESEDVARAIEDASQRTVTQEARSFARQLAWPKVADDYESALRRVQTNVHQTRYQ